MCRIDAAFEFTARFWRGNSTFWPVGRSTDQTAGSSAIRGHLRVANQSDQPVSGVHDEGGGALSLRGFYRSIPRFFLWLPAPSGLRFRIVDFRDTGKQRFTGAIPDRARDGDSRMVPGWRSRHLHLVANLQ